ncbi:hypothetical protein [uncultured Methylibium sp.]|uniref:recombination directionality factor n=1 Tax=uncultured Methylibium sp. TaxID=381093 RepID=UPI0025D3C6FD|nr:hypothetical protein [uncultured Methylibium sp.]
MAAMDSGSTNGRTQLAPVSSGALAVPTLLGRSAMRIPIGGRIRAGIKVLTRKAEESAEARAIYGAGVAAGKAFDTIEREIAQRCPSLKNPLTPKNVPYFTVRGEDFPNPELARQIMDMYAEDRGEGGKRLYRFPVVFPADAWQNVMPHELVTWTASERRYWSEYSEDGQTRYCKTHEAVPVDGNGRRTIRIFGGRKTVLREENAGLCDPESCPEYQAKKCNLTGRFIFFIPGIKSISAFDLQTNSFYAMQAAIEKFTTIGFMRGGRISGFLDGQRTPFYISKRLVEVSRIDDEGRATRVAQWLIELEAPVDVTSLLRPDDGLEALEARAGEAAAMLDGGHVEARPAGDSDDGVVDVAARAVDGPELSSQAQGGSQRREAWAPTEQSTRTEAAGAPREGRDRTAPRAAAGADELAGIFGAAAALGVEQARFEAYADKRWGRGWKLATGGRKRALEEVSSFADDAAGFQEKVRGELEVFS